MAKSLIIMSFVLTTFVLLPTSVLTQLFVPKIIGSVCLNDKALLQIMCRNLTIEDMLPCKCCGAKFLLMKAWNGPNSYCLLNTEKLDLKHCKTKFKDELKEVVLTEEENDFCLPKYENALIAYAAEYFGGDKSVAEAELKRLKDDPKTLEK